jgi:hypothetical protein
MREPIGIRMTEKGYVDGPLFRLRYRLASGPIEITVWDGGFQEPNHTRNEILLGTGGPAVRIVGELDSTGPRTARLEVQDWFTPWTEYTKASEQLLLAYVECFCWEETS